jgi:tRNA G18 (ribose-2'-O)-methylase SpoU
LSGYVGIKDSELRRMDDSFIVEGSLAVRRLFESDWGVTSVLLLSRTVEAMSDVVARAESRQVPVYVAPAEVFDATAGFNVHRGVLAVAPRPAPRSPAALARQADHPVVVVEGINDQENLGAIFRNAAVLGAGAVFMDPSCCDPLYRRTVRVSLGHALRVPFARFSEWPDGLASLSRFSVVALSPDADQTIDEFVLTRPHCVAVLVGSEGPGLTAAARAAAEAVVRIPMAAAGDCLNVATALAIALHRLQAVGFQREL